MSLIIGFLLISINFYGLTQPLRRPGLGIDDHNELRFVPKEVWSYNKSMEAIDSLSQIEQKNVIAANANRIVNLSLIHVDWNRVSPTVYRQLIPIWENYFLYFLGRYSGLPQFERYHYANYKRNIRRGIGICGDASTVLSSILDRYSIQNRIFSFRGHVIVEYTDDDGQSYLMDPDFGVSLGVDIEDLVEDPQKVQQVYLDAGYSERETDFLLEIYKKEYAIFDNTYQFMQKRYLFEHISYVAKWLLPILLIVFSMRYLKKFFHYTHNDQGRVYT